MSRYISEAVKQYVWERDKGKCVYCGYRYWNDVMSWLRKKTGEQWQQLEMGHVIPFSDGGNNCIENIQLECFRCNRSKGAEYRKLGFLKRWLRDEAEGCKGRCGHLSS